MRRAFGPVLAWVLLCGGTAGAEAAPRPASDPTAYAWMARAAANFTQIRSIVATIDQLLVQGTRTVRYQGHYVALAPGRFRIEYRRPEPQLVVSDGRRLWWEIPSRRKVWRTSLQARRPEVVGSVGFEDLLPERDDVYYRWERSWWRFWAAPRIRFQGVGRLVTVRGYVETDADRPVPTRVVFLAADVDRPVLERRLEHYERIGDVWLPLETRTVDHRGHTEIVTRYHGVRLNVPVEPRRFVYEPPADYEVVELNLGGT